MDNSSEIVLGLLERIHISTALQELGLRLFAFLFLGSCAVLSSPVQTLHDPPTLSLEIPQNLPSGIHLQLRATSFHNANEIFIYRAIDNAPFELWKTIQIASIKEELNDGIVIKDGEIEYGSKVQYQALIEVQKNEILSPLVSLTRREGPKNITNIKTHIRMGAVFISWTIASKENFFTLIYRRNILEDAPLKIVSSMITGNEWVDTEIIAGVYSYQLSFATKQGSTLNFGPLSDPIYVTIENEQGEEDLNKVEGASP